MNQLVKILLKQRKTIDEYEQVGQLLEQLEIFQDIQVLQDLKLKFLQSINIIYLQKGESLFVDSKSYIILNCEIVKQQQKRYSINYLNIKAQQSRVLASNKVILKQNEYITEGEAYLYVNKPGFILELDNDQFNLLVKKRLEINNLKLLSIKIVFPQINKIISQSVIDDLCSMGFLKYYHKDCTLIEADIQFAQNKLQKIQSPKNNKLIMILIEGRCEVFVNIHVKPQQEENIITKNFSPQRTNILTHKVAVLESFNLIGDEALLSTDDLDQLDIGLSNGTYMFGVRSISNRVRVLEFSNNDILERFPKMSVKRVKQMTIEKLKIRVEELKQFMSKVVNQMESQGNNKCIKRMFSDAVICLKEEKRVKTLMNDIKCSQSRKELKSIDDVIDSCMKNAYDFGDYDQKRRKVANRLIQQGLFLKKTYQQKDKSQMKIRVGKLKTLKTETSNNSQNMGCRIRSYMSQHMNLDKENKIQRSRSNFGNL